MSFSPTVLTPPETTHTREFAALPHLIKSRSRRKTRFLIVFAICLAWVLAETGASWLVQHTHIRQGLNRRLEAALGRPVEVGRYSVSLRGIPSLQAHSVTVAEDPRFGNEYFLYAESLTLRVHWLPLLIGRVELGSIFISNPSLNLVRSKEGRWNIEEWLPVPAELFPETSSTNSNNSATENAPEHLINSQTSPVAPLVRSITLTGGRINFKRGDEKSAFCLVKVAGSVERQNAGRWWLNLEASPARAAVILQQAGTIHVQGEVGGTSSRLRPANIQVTWRNAAVADALRLATAYDHGIRGAFSAAFTAHAQGTLWNLSGRAELRHLHRWDLAMRPDNPALNLEVSGDWLPEASALHIASASLETPRSKITGSGAISWDPNTDLVAQNWPRDFSVSTLGVDAADILAWIRAFVPSMSNDVILKGSVAANLKFRGSPPAPVGGWIATDNVSLEGGSLPAPLYAQDARVIFTPQGARLLPSVVAIGASGGALRAEGSCAPSGPICEAKLSGHAADVEDLTAAVSAVGWSLPAGWHVGGPANFDLQWLLLGPLSPTATATAAQPPTGQSPTGQAPTGQGPTGWITFQDLSLRAPFLNQPVAAIKGRIDFTPVDAQLNLASADAFGGNWSGTLDLIPHGGERRFSLSANRLNAEDLDRWLNPRWRQGFLQNVLPFLGAAPQRAPLAPGARAQGHLSIDEFAFTRYTMNRLQGDLTLEASHVELQDAEATFYGGKLAGQLRADFSASPSYKVNARFSGLDLATLTAGSSVLPNVFGGSASGNLALEFTGAGRQELASTLQCEGAAEIQNASWKGLDLLASLRAGEARQGSTSAADAAGNFTCANRRIEISNLRVAVPAEILLVTGTLDSARTLDFHLTRLPRLSAIPSRIADARDAAPTATFLLQGPLLHPTISPVQNSRRQSNAAPPDPASAEPPPVQSTPMKPTPVH